MVSIEKHSIFKNTLLSDFFILESLLDLSDRANIVNLIIEDDRKENQVNRSKLYKGQLSCNVWATEIQYNRNILRIPNPTP